MTSYFTLTFIVYMLFIVLHTDASKEKSDSRSSQEPNSKESSQPNSLTSSSISNESRPSVERIEPKDFEVKPEDKTTEPLTESTRTTEDKEVSSNVEIPENVPQEA